MLDMRDETECSAFLRRAEEVSGIFDDNERQAVLRFVDDSVRLAQRALAANAGGEAPRHSA
jgi:hypothetical protein